MNEISATHLVERAAQRLRQQGGLGAPPRPPMPADEPPITVLPPDLAREVAPATEVAEPLPSVTMAALERIGVAVSAGRRNRVAEEFSVIAGTLLRALRAGPPPDAPARTGFANLMLVTSARPGEGKSFSSTNLAATIAHNGLARVVLVDIDPKPNSITAELGLSGRPGLFELAADGALRPEALLVATPIRDLSVLPLGQPQGSGEGLARRVTAAVERVARRFANRVVVLDSPPCLATSEPAALAPMVGLIAMVVEAERTQRVELEQALDLIATCPQIMLLLNKTRGGAGHAFGAYDYYGT